MRLPDFVEDSTKGFVSTTGVSSSKSILLLLDSKTTRSLKAWGFYPNKIYFAMQYIHQTKSIYAIEIDLGDNDSVFYNYF